MSDSSESSDSDIDDTIVVRTGARERLSISSSSISGDSRSVTETSSDGSSSDYSETITPPSYPPIPIASEEVKKSISRKLKNKYTVTGYDGCFDNHYTPRAFIAINKETDERVGVRMLVQEDYCGINEDFFETIGGKQFLKIRHRHVSRCHEVFKDVVGGESDCFYLITDHFEYGSIFHILGSFEEKLGRNNYFEKEIAAIVKSVLLGLAYLHKRCLVHKDLKSEYLQLTHDGVVKIETIECIDTFANMNINRRRRGSLIGSPYWMSPEVLQEHSTKELPSRDIWSLGICMIEMAERNPPHSNIHPMRAIFMIPNIESPKFQKPKSWSPEMNDFLARCLEKEPHRRPTACELLRHPWMKMYFGDDDDSHILFLQNMIQKYILDIDPNIKQDENERMEYLLEEDDLFEKIKINLCDGFKKKVLKILLV